MTEAPKCEDCAHFSLFASRLLCTHPNVAEIDIHGARLPISFCGHKGDLFEPKEGKADE